MTSPRPAFLLSLPRSGSTMVQRVLATRPGVATTAEPWVALPFVYALRDAGIATEYDQETAVAALRGFVDALPEGPATFQGEIRGTLHRLYAAAAGPGARWFLDKTPRYSLIIDDLLRLFPDAPIIVLWRNPLAIVASMTTTWYGGHWYPHRHAVDLVDGLAGLVKAVSAHPDRFVAVRYEDLVTGPQAWSGIASRLRVDIDAQALVAGGRRRIEGEVGDPTQDRYRTVTSAPLDTWPQHLASPVRRRWAVGYLDWLGRERLAVMGYDRDRLLADLHAAPTRRTQAARDVWALGREHVRFALRRWRTGGLVAGERGPGTWPRA